MTIQWPNPRLRLFILSLSLFCFGITAAQSTARGQTATTVNPDPILFPPGHIPPVKPPRVTITNVRFETVSKSSSTTSVAAAPDRKPNRSPLPTNGSSVRIEPTGLYVYSMDVTNNGTRAIKAIAWDYRFTEPSFPLIIHYSFANLQKIDPGQKVTVRFTTRSGPPKPFSELAEKAGIPFEQDVLFQCIIYADGLTWQQLTVTDTNPCERLKRWIKQRRKTEPGLEDLPFNP
ncbi:MAG TPA: hypothetical protein VE863_19490 [Pyrinomonadaceae bacterium]|jgi:hypothetical protein|nr:hypothetical protein [Pyrinomonadaceae bacterium]